MSELLLARQPILDRKQSLIGYELLFRPAAGEVPGGVDGDSATARVIVTSLVEMGLEKLVGEHDAFLNMTGGLLRSEMIRLLPRERVVLEVLETVDVDPGLVETIRGLSAQGYRIALDDFEWKPEKAELVKLANFIKLDVRILGREGIQRQLELLRGARARFPAEKVETHEEWQWCADLGFECFQGYYFCRPRVLSGKGLPTRHMTVMLILAKLHDPDVSYDEVDRLMRSDVGLTHRLLKIINSAYYGLPRKIESIKDALVLLGINKTRMWASLIALAGIREKPREAFTTALVRARMCELLAKGTNRPNADRYFMTGLLSTLGALLDKPMAEVLRELPVADIVREALLERKGELGAALNCAEAHETATWDAMRFPGLDERRIRDLYLEAVEWARGIEGQIGG